jgi:hypothetical protein
MARSLCVVPLERVPDSFTTKADANGPGAGDALMQHER